MLLQRLLRLQHDSLSALITQKKTSVVEHEDPFTRQERLGIRVFVLAMRNWHADPVDLV
jgi:hypothetical protein